VVCRWRRRVCDAELGIRMERERSAVKVIESIASQDVYGDMSSNI